MSHTPGPWTVDDDTRCVLAVNELPGDIVCMEPDAEASAERWEENARLIAAAPEMLSALGHYADQLCEGWCEQSPDCAHFEDCAGCLARRTAYQATGAA